MNIKKVEYTPDDAGYEAMVQDITSLFSWDAVEGNTEGTFTSFKKFNDGNRYVGIRVTRTSSGSPTVCIFCSNGTSFFLSPGNNESQFVSYVYDTNFLVMDCSKNCKPNTSDNYVHIVGISTSVNLISGDTGYCAFKYKANSLYFYSKNTDSDKPIVVPLTVNSVIGAAYQLHNPQAYDISDRFLILTAIPDDLKDVCLSVAFNGMPYTRVGRFLIQT